MKLIILIITFMSVFMSDNIAYSKPILTIYTEEFPPFNYRNQDKILGGSTEIVEEIMKQAKMEYSIKLLPWSRAYKLVQQDPNSLIYSISRRKDRENLFTWVAKIAPSNNSIYALKGSNIKISSLSDLNNFKIGTTFDDARDTYLIGKGIPRSQILRTGGISGHFQNYQKLISKRIDLWPMPNAVAANILKNKGINIDEKLEIAFKLSEISSGGYYLAANLEMDNAIIEKLRKAMAKMQKSGFTNKVLQKWKLE